MDQWRRSQIYLQYIFSVGSSRWPSTKQFTITNNYINHAILFSFSLILCFISAFRAALPLSDMCRTKTTICTELAVTTLSLKRLCAASLLTEWMVGWHQGYECESECVSLMYSPAVCACVSPSSSDYSKAAWWLVISCAYDNGPEAKCRTSIRSLSSHISSVVCFC